MCMDNHSDTITREIRVSKMKQMRKHLHTRKLTLGLL